MTKKCENCYIEVNKLDIGRCTFVAVVILGYSFVCWCPFYFLVLLGFNAETEFELLAQVLFGAWMLCSVLAFGFGLAFMGESVESYVYITKQIKVKKGGAVMYYTD